MNSTPRRRRRRRRGRVAFGPLGILLVLMSGCRMTIVPPTSPEDPVPVFVLDYGRHASIMLPRDDRMVEYAYGEWSWYANDRTQWYMLTGALAWPTRGALGRGVRETPPQPQAIRAASPRTIRDMLQIDAASARVETLADRLDAEFARGAEARRVHNQRYDMVFVPAGPSYHALHTCRDAVTSWLRELGCEVHGTWSWTRFTLAPGHSGSEAASAGAAGPAAR